jgi:hypothetical protein
MHTGLRSRGGAPMFERPLYEHAQKPPRFHPGALTFEHFADV